MPGLAMYPHPSGLTSRRWVVDTVGEISMRFASADDYVHADGHWPARRRPTDGHLHWIWKDILRGKREALAVHQTGVTAALWCSRKKSPIKLDATAFYRLDYLEIDPALRGGFFGHFVLALIACRALELGADGVVLGSLDGANRFYETMGGEQRCPRGWQSERGLTPFVFDRTALENLREHADAFDTSPETKSVL